MECVFESDIGEGSLEGRGRWAVWEGRRGGKGEEDEEKRYCPVEVLRDS